MLAVYRGWMLRPDRYQALYDALLARGLRLINDPEAYRHAHHLPEAYPILEEWTARSVWTSLEGALDMAAVLRLVEVFGSRPILLKDYVKSRKHEWDEACFIPDASDAAGVELDVARTVDRTWKIVEIGDGQVSGLPERVDVAASPRSTAHRTTTTLSRSANQNPGSVISVTEAVRHVSSGRPSSPLQQPKSSTEG